MTLEGGGSPDKVAPHPRPLAGLLVAQFFGAFNDNAYKLFVALLGIRSIASLGEAGGAFERAAQSRTTLAFVVFTLPLILFSIPGGAIADKISKRSVIVTLKGVEILLMAAATLVLYLQPGGGTLLLLVLALMGTQSALFSPAKYGILPEVLPHDRLSAGNGLLELWTFLAIIAGTASGALLLDATGNGTWRGGVVLTGLACLGWIASWRVPRVPPAGGRGRMVETVAAAWSVMRAERVLGMTVVGLASFWAVASLLGQNILVYGKVVLALSDTGTGILLAVFGLGVGGGALLAGRLSSAKVEYGLIPLGALGFAIFSLMLALAAPALWGTLVLLALMGVSSGLLIVPLDALLQWQSPADHRGAVIALSNVFVFAGVMAGSIGVQVFAAAGLTARQILTVAAVMTLAGTVAALRLLPDALLRLVLILMTNSFYRLKVVGRDHVPVRGGGLLVPNHVSFMDGLFLMASLDRRVRFMVDADYFHHPVLRPFMKALGAIPVSASGGPRVVLRAFREAGKALGEGSLVGIFAEGEITRTGSLLPFRRGLERIVRNQPVPIVPVHLDRVWGSVMTRPGGRVRWSRPHRIPWPITVSFGAPLPPHTPIPEVRRAVHELGVDAWEHRRPDMRPLHHELIRSARRHPFGFAMADPSHPRLSRYGVVAAAIGLARALRGPWTGQEAVGCLLPPGIAGALVNIAASLSGRIAVNLNYTAGAAGMESAARQARLRTVVTSREFLEKGKIPMPAGVVPVLVEDVAAGMGRGARLAGFLLTLAPVRLIERACGATGAPQVDDTATCIFSSGSTGEPKGVLLSHFNVGSNVEAVAQVFRVEPSDRVLGVLPFFHSFGYLALWFALRRRMGMAFHPSPLDGAGVGECVQRYRVTFLLATPTFLQIYMRRCTPAQFGSLRVVLAGAERLPERLGRDFEDQFGIRPLEGYGTTECSPAIAVSVPDYRAAGFYQPGSRRGFTGQPLPGVAVRIVDPESCAILPDGSEGLILVRGPNVMKGYLGREDLTAAVIRDGWYVTGDIGSMDEDGFLRITDRLSRFAKIGGEMVPHGRVEEALHEAAGVAGAQVFLVTSIPDPQRGERLAVIHTLDESAIPGVVEALRAAGLPNLFIPRREAFIRVDALPVLGTGKSDLREARRIAQERLGST